MNKKLKNARLEKILWLDLEMTGLDPNNDLILEVGAIVTDWEFNEIDSYHGIIQHDSAKLNERLATNAVFWDANPESKNGLVEQNKHGKSLVEIEDETLEFLNTNFESDLPILLGGNSVHMDRRFIVNYWKRFDKRLHYRMLDVSAWKVVFENKFGIKFAKPDNHRALDDIRGSIAELKYYLAKFK